MAKQHGKLVSQMVSIKENIAVDDYNLIQVLTADGVPKHQFMTELVDEAIAICEQLDVIIPLTRGLQHVYAYATLVNAAAVAESTGIGDVDLSRKAARLNDALSGEDPADFGARCYSVLTRLELADGLAALGDSVESETTESAAMAIARGRADVFYQCAVEYAERSQRFAKREGSNLSNAARDKLLKRYARRVITLLHEAVASGFKDVGRLRNDHAFDPFRADPEYEALAEDVAFPVEAFRHHNEK